MQTQVLISNIDGCYAPSTFRHHTFAHLLGLSSKHMCTIGSSPGFIYMCTEMAIPTAMVRLRSSLGSQMDMSHWSVQPGHTGGGGGSLYSLALLVHGSHTSRVYFVHRPRAQQKWSVSLS
jgi:hypothetical protein